MPALADTLDRRRPEHEANRAAQLAHLEELARQHEAVLTGS